MPDVRIPSFRQAMSKPSKVDLQNEFVKTLVRLFTWLDLNGYKVSLGEAYRPPEMAAIYAQQGKGITKSLHCERLAIDLNIFKGDALLVTVDELRVVGDTWESFSTQEFVFAWGGYFLRPDSDHFSLAFEGRK